MKTEQQINEEMRLLSLQRQQVIDATLSQTIYTMFEKMTKEEVLAKIGEMMEASPMLKMEVKRLLVDKPVDILVVEVEE
jgi:hypothetical protein